MGCCILSIITILSSVVFGIMFGKEIWQRKDPFTSETKVFKEDSYVYFKDFPFFFQLKDGEQNIYENFDDYMDILFETIQYRNYTLQFVKTHLDQNVKAVKCQDEHFLPLYGKISEDEINSFKLKKGLYCINWDPLYDWIQNPYESGANYQFTSIGFRFCENTNGRECPSDLDFLKIEPFITMNILDAYVNVLDFSHPIQYYFRSLHEPLIINKMKRNYIRIANGAFDSDNGWLIEDYQTTSYYFMESMNQFIGDFPNDEVLYKMVYFVTLESPRLSTVYKRKYLKIQELFAKIGGLINAFMIISKILLIDYMKYSYRMKIRENTCILVKESFYDKFVFNDLEKMKQGFKSINENDGSQESKSRYCR